MLVFLIAAVAALFISGIVFVNCAPQLGASAGVMASKTDESGAPYADGKFSNLKSISIMLSGKDTFKSTIEFFRGGKNREPEVTLPSHPLRITLFDESDETPQAVWLGHSTVLIHINGKTLITDPVFSNRASMFSFAGPKRFPYQNQYSVDDLPQVDAVIISHDHYDHLDYKSILALKDSVKQFFVPLGVGAHLESWGVSSDKIIELDWWEEYNFSDEIKLAAAPAQHFSGRGITDRNKTLWASWIIQSENHRIFFGGDSGYFESFKEIGEKFGPFDLTLLECGAYNEYWPDVHMMPEQTAQAHLDLKGKLLLPIHWAKFNLSLHSWTDPIERISAESERLGILLATPEIGERFALDAAPLNQHWWEEFRVPHIVSLNAKTPSESR